MLKKSTDKLPQGITIVRMEAEHDAKLPLWASQLVGDQTFTNPSEAKTWLRQQAEKLANQ